MPETMPPIIWLSLLLAGLIAGSFLAISRYLNYRTSQDVKKLGIELRRIQSLSRALFSQAQRCSGRDPEPYRSIAVRLHASTSAIRHNLKESERRYVELNESLTSQKHHPWRTTLRAPLLWPHLRREVLELRNDLEQLSNSLTEAEGIEHQIRSLPWEISLQMRGLHMRLREVIQRMDGLGNRGLYGDTFEAAAHQGQEIQAAFLKIPSGFLDDTEADIVQSATKEETVRVYEIIAACSPKLNELFEKVDQWEADYAAVTARLNKTNDAVVKLEQVLSNLPELLHASAEKGGWKKMNEISRNLLSTSTRLEVESIPLVSLEADRLKSAADEMCRDLTRAQSDLLSLTSLLGEIKTVADHLSSGFKTLGSKNLYPVRWAGGMDKHAELISQIDALGEANSPRTPQHVTTEFANAAQIRVDLSRLKRQVEQIIQKHTSLIANLENPTIQQLPEWIRRSRELISETNSYSADNWHPGDNPSQLIEQINQISAEYNRLVARDQNAPISELELEEKLASSRQLSEECEKLIKRVDDHRVQWESLLSAEAQAKEKIESLTKTLTQIQMIAQSNPFLDRLASKEIHRLILSTGRLKQKLDQRKQGGLDAKVRETISWLADVGGHFTRWLDELDHELLTRRSELAQTLKSLDEIAPLEDPPVDKARRLLNSHSALIDTWKISRKPLDPGEIVFSIKERSEIWQEYIAAKNALDSVQQLLDTYHAARSQRESALQLITELPEWKSDKRTWPPVSTSFQADRLELDKLEKEWKASKARSAQAISLVAHYTLLTSRYQALVDQIQLSLDHRNAERIMAAELDAQIAATAGEWESLLQLYADNPSASREIQDFLSSLDQALEEIERGYLRAELEYDQVVLQLNAALRRARFYQVALDDEHALDASGRVIRRLHSERE